MKLLTKTGGLFMAICCATTSITSCGKSNTEFTPITPEIGEIVTLANDDVAKFLSNYEEGQYCAMPYENRGDCYFMKDLTLKWRAPESATPDEILVSRSPDLSNAEKYVSSNGTITLTDLFVNTTYYWQISNGDKYSDTFPFSTANTPRTISIDGVSNTRDLGGKFTDEGKKIKQDILFRGAKLDDVTDKGKKDFLEKYRIKTDLDLRSPTEGYKNGSPVGNEVRYLNILSPYYTGVNGIDDNTYHENLAEIMRVFADEKNFPVYFHCAIGRDRTGTVAILLLGLCGVSTKDIFIDYELSFFSQSGCCDGTSISAVSEKVSNTFRCIEKYGKKYGGNNLSFKECCAAYLRQIGLTQTEIDSIRDNLIEK